MKFLMAKIQIKNKYKKIYFPYIQRKKTMQHFSENKNTNYSRRSEVCWLAN